MFALESSISLLRAPSAPLTAYGEYVQIALRLLGPLFCFWLVGLRSGRTSLAVRLRAAARVIGPGHGH